MYRSGKIPSRTPMTIPSTVSTVPEVSGMGYSSGSSRLVRQKPSPHWHFSRACAMPVKTSLYSL